MSLQREYGYGRGTDIRVQEYSDNVVRFSFGRGLKHLTPVERQRTIDADCVAAFDALNPYSSRERKTVHGNSERGQN